MKSIDWKKGFSKLTLVVSILVFLVLSVVVFDKTPAWALGRIIFFSLVWLVYFVIAFILKGFAGKD